tara:strand:- start:13293 stop:13682 length:390 start_codon:yes stop_codon:yes gene_type:complete
MSTESKKFSKSWKSSGKPRKQRKFRFNAPFHIRHKFVRAMISKELRKKHDKRNLSIRTGDKVKIMRGSFKKKEGKVERVDLKKSKIYILGVESSKKDGTKVKVGINPSNLMITEINLDDKRRQKILQRK